jgi:hypothetical protein
VFNIGCEAGMLAEKLAFKRYNRLEKIFVRV